MTQSKTKQMLLALCAVVVGALVALSCTTYASAAATGSIKITGATGIQHTLNAYQVFAGDYSNAGGSEKLSNVTWGSGVDGAALLTALKANNAFGSGDANLFKNATTAENVADIVAGFTTDDQKKAFADTVATGTGVLKDTAKSALAYDGTGKTYTVTGLAEGYWAVVDQTPAATNIKEEHLSPVVLQVIGGSESSVASKVSSTTYGKDEQENRSVSVAQVGDGTTGYGATADYQNGSEVPFRVWASVPADYQDYAAAKGGSGYALEFNDTLGTGLTFTSTSVKAYLVSMSGGVPNYSEIGTGTQLDASVFTVNAQGQTVKFANADLTAVSGKDFGGKAVVILYTAKLNATAASATGIENQITVTHTSDKSGNKDTTPGKKTFTFTYKLDSTKVDANNTNTKLQGATFKLLNADKSKAAKLDALGNITDWETYTESSDTGGTPIVSKADGTFPVLGLDGGETGKAVKYYLLETAAPTGYNKLAAPIEFWIESATSVDESTGAGKITTLNLHVGDSTTNGTTTTATVTQTITNKQGNSLPETGGMGTTIFVVVGLVLVISAGAVFVMRRRQA